MLRPWSVTSSVAGSDSGRRKRVKVSQEGTRGLSTRQNQSVRENIASSRPTTQSLRSDHDESSVVQQDHDDENLDETVMALDMRNRDTIGCAYYVSRDEKLYLMSDIKHGDVEIIRNLKIYIQPTVLVVSSRVDALIDEHRDDSSSGDPMDNDEGHTRLPFILETRPAPEFGYESGKRRLVDLRIDTDRPSRVDFRVPGDSDGEGQNQEIDPGFSTRQGNLLWLTARIDLESRLSVGCAGAVLSYLRRRRTAQYLPGDLDACNMFRVSRVEMFSLDGSMFLSADAVHSLQILESDFHPHSQNQGPVHGSHDSKEGLSAFGLFCHLARTPQGKALLRKWFLRPSLSVETIVERQTAISTFIRTDNDTVLEDLISSLKHISNIRPVLIHLRKGISSGRNKAGGIRSSVWSSLSSFAFHTLGIRSAISQLKGTEQMHVRMMIMEKFDHRRLGMVGRSIEDVIDFESSVEAHRAVVKIGVDRELDDVKRAYDGLDAMLSQLSQKVAEDIPNAVKMDLNVVFIPQIGYLISIPIDPWTRQPKYSGSNEEGRQWDKIFSTEDRVYFKDYRMRDMDTVLGDVYVSICDREIEILHELGNKMLDFEALLCEVSDICAELDCLVALTQGAKLYNLNRPKISHRNVVSIQGGRHFLQERTVPTFIPNDTNLVGASDEQGIVDESGQGHQDDGHTVGPNLFVMTGPNFSGKSIYLKQVALIVFLAHVGSFVPAESADIGITDMILTRMSTRETVSKVQSAFMIDLQQISSILQYSTHRSLVLIDEFGKGTDSADGAGLLYGVLDHFLHLESRPKVLAATHFHEIFENGFLQPQPGLAFGHMEIRLDKRASAAQEQVTYLYHLREGRSLSSYGATCAALNGVDQAVVDRAEELLLLSVRGADMVSACAQMSDAEAAELEGAESIARKFITKDLPDANSLEFEKFDAIAFLETILEGA